MAERSGAALISTVEACLCLPWLAVTAVPGAAGYTLFRSISPLGEEMITDVTGPYLGDHGSCRPTTRFGRGGEIGCFFATGSGFKHGYVRPFPITPDSVMPTLLAIAGEKPLAHQEGAVLYDLLSSP